MLEAQLPPAFTIGVDAHLRSRMVELLKRRDDVRSRYTKALEVWERVSADPIQHPDYMPLLCAELWTAIVKKNAAAVRRNSIDQPRETDIIVAETLRERNFLIRYAAEAILPCSADALDLEMYCVLFTQNLASYVALHTNHVRYVGDSCPQ